MIFILIPGLVFANLLNQKLWNCRLTIWVHKRSRWFWSTEAHWSLRTIAPEIQAKFTFYQAQVVRLNILISSVAQSCPTLCDPMNRSTPGLPIHPHLPEFTQTHVHRVRDAIQSSHPLLSPSPPAPNPSQHQSLFQWVNSSQKWPKYQSFSLSIIPSKEHPGLISFRMDWLDLLAVQRTLKSLLQHCSSKALKH